MSNNITVLDISNNTVTVNTFCNISAKQIAEAIKQVHPDLTVNVKYIDQNSTKSYTV